MKKPSAHEVANVATDILISRLSQPARTALLRNKPSNELHEAGLCKFGSGLTDLGMIVRARLATRRGGKA